MGPDGLVEPPVNTSGARSLGYALANLQAARGERYGALPPWTMPTTLRHTTE